MAAAVGPADDAAGENVDNCPAAVLHSRAMGAEDAEGDGESAGNGGVRASDSKRKRKAAEPADACLCDWSNDGSWTNLVGRSKPPANEKPRLVMAN